MTTETATDAMTNVNKRVRFEEPTSAPPSLMTSTKISENTAPKGVSLNLVHIFAKSLQKRLSPIFLKAGESHVDHLHKLLTKVRQFTKMEDDDDFIPRSARLVEFEFRTSKMVEDSPAFQTIKADTIVLIKDFRLALKQQIMATLKIEIEMLKTEMYANLMKGIHICVTAHLISEQKKLNVHKVVSTIVKHHFEELFAHTDMEISDFYNYYKKELNIPIFPFPDGTPTQVEPTDMTEDIPVIMNPATVFHRESLNSKFAIFSTFTLPGRAYFKRTEDIEIELSLKKLHSDDSLEEATINTADRLNAETSIDMELLQSIIASEVAAKTKKLNSEVGQLKKKLSIPSSDTTSKSATSKNQRGRTKKQSGASSTKKKSRSKSPSSKPLNGRRKKPGPKAGDRDNATSKKPKKPKRKPVRKKNEARS